MNRSTAAPRVLICRLSAMGDCIHTLPVACALRRQFPQAYIAWLTQPVWAPLLERHPAIDEVLTAPRDYLQRPKVLMQLRKSLKARRFDTAIDVQSLTKSAVAAWLSGAKTRIGFAAPEGRELAPWLNTVNVPATKTHAVDQFLELLAPLSIETRSAEFQLPVDAVATTRVQQFLARERIQQRPLVVHPGAGWDSKLWVNSRYAEVAKAIGQQLGMKTVVAWAGSRCKAWADEIVAQADGFAVAAPETTLAELTALLRAARLYLGSDSGPLHMAAAVGTPCIGMFGTSKPQRNGPYGEGHISLQAYYQEGTRRQRQNANNDAMQAITTEIALQACRELLAKTSGKSRVA